MLKLNIKYIFYGFILFIAALVFGHFYNLEKESIKGNFVAEQTKIAADEKAKDEKATNKVETKYETITKTEIQYVDRIITKKVIEYRDRVVNRCVLDPEWVRTYNLSTDQAGAESGTAIAYGSSKADGKTTN